MPKEDVLLSICLATFNRSSKLKRTLTALTDQICVLQHGRIEVVVGDNHSEDDTEAVLKECAAGHGFVTYVRHEKNLGAEANYKSVIEKSRGEFIWLLSDDDYILEGCVRRLLEALRGNPDVHYVFLNYLLWREKEGRVGGPSQCAAKADCRVTGIDEFFLQTRFANSFISSNVYRRATWEEVNEKWFLDTYWPQLYISCKLAEKFPAYVIAEPVLMMGCLPIEESRAEKARQGNDHFYMDAHLTYLRFIEYATARMADPEAKRLAIDYVLIDNLYQIEHYRNNANRHRFTYNLSVFAQMRRFAPLRKRMSFWLVEVPALLTPPIFYGGFSRYRKFRNDLPGWRDSKQPLKQLAYEVYRMGKAVKRSVGKRVATKIL